VKPHCPRTNSTRTPEHSSQHRPWNPEIVEMQITSPATFNLASSNRRPLDHSCIHIMSNKHRGIGVDERVKNVACAMYKVLPKRRPSQDNLHSLRVYSHNIFLHHPPSWLTFYAVALAPVSVVEVTLSISIFGMLADALPKSVCLALGFLV